MIKISKFQGFRFLLSVIQKILLITLLPTIDTKNLIRSIHTVTNNALTPFSFTQDFDDVDDDEGMDEIVSAKDVDEDDEEGSDEENPGT